MSNENTCKNDFEKFQRNYNKNNSNTENQSISNSLPRSDLRNKINKNKRKPDFDNFVIECQAGEINESECRIRKIQIGHKLVFTSVDIELYKEYVQWDFINNKLYMKGKNVLGIVDNEGKQEFTNTLKSWFNIINKDFKEVAKYEYYTILPKITVEHLAAQFLRKELIAKKFVTEQNANDKICEILNFISKNHSQVPPCNLVEPMNVEYDRDRNILSVDKFRSLKVPRDKLLLSDESEIISAAKLLLRGESLGNNFHDKESRFVECRQEQQQQSTRINNELEWRNPPRHNNDIIIEEKNWKNRQNNKEGKRKIDCSNKYSERNDKIVNDWQQQQQSTCRVINESELRNRARYNSNNKQARLSSFSGNRNHHHHHQMKESNEEWQSQKVTTRVNDELEWRNPPRYNNDINNEEKNWRNRQNNKEEKRNIDCSNKYSERNEVGQSLSKPSPRVNNESEQRNPARHNKNNNNSSKSSNNNKEEEEVVLSSLSDIDLYKEYVQWDFINNKLYERGEFLLNVASKKERQEFTNTLQRWFIFINEDFNEVPKYEYFTILPDIRLEHTAAQFLRDAIIEKKFANKEDADEADWKIKKILGFISSGHSEVVPHESADPLYVKHDPDRKIVVVNKFQSEEVPRVNLLVEKGGVIATARMLLRYESFGNGSYQWGDPQNVHKVLYDKFNVRYEGFASPVNSRFIEYDKTHFCSLFPETDAVFGSIGNFFHVDMEKHAGGWSVNPPFLNDLMKNVADRIIKILDEGHKCYFFCTFPWWEDDEGWQTLIKSRHFLRRFDLLPQHFIVQDAYGNQFEPNMKMNLFVMGELPSTVARLTELGQELIINRDDIKDHHINYKDCPW